MVQKLNQKETQELKELLDSADKARRDDKIEYQQYFKQVRRRYKGALKRIVVRLQKHNSVNYAIDRLYDDIREHQKTKNYYEEESG